MYNRIIELRKEKGLKQKDVYEAISMDGSQYSKFEKGERNLTMQQLADISVFLEVSTDYLIFGLDKNSKTKTSPSEELEDVNLSMVAEDSKSYGINLRSLSKGQLLILERLARIEGLLQVAGLNDDKRKDSESAGKKDNSVSEIQDVHQTPRRTSRGK